MLQRAAGGDDDGSCSIVDNQMGNRVNGAVEIRLQSRAQWELGRRRRSFNSSQGWMVSVWDPASTGEDRRNLIKNRL